MREENIANRPFRHGVQGKLNEASKGTKENEFGTSNDDEVIKQILEKGTVSETMVRQSVTFKV